MSIAKGSDPASVVAILVMFFPMESGLKKLRVWQVSAVNNGGKFKKPIFPELKLGSQLSC